MVNSVPKEMFEPMWNFCDADKDDVVTGTELGKCVEKAATFLQLPEGENNND